MLVGDPLVTPVDERRPPFRFSYSTRVGFDETDAQGIVYYGRYMPYFDRARVDRPRRCPLGAGRHAAAQDRPGRDARPRHRAAMVELAIAGNPRFRMSRVELERQGPSYSVDTVRELTGRRWRCWPEPSRVLLLSSEALRALPSWHEPERADLARADRRHPQARLSATVTAVDRGALPGSIGSLHRAQRSLARPLVVRHPPTSVRRPLDPVPRAGAPSATTSKPTASIRRSYGRRTDPKEYP